MQNKQQSSSQQQLKQSYNILLNNENKNKNKNINKTKQFLSYFKTQQCTKKQCQQSLSSNLKLNLQSTLNNLKNIQIPNIIQKYNLSCDKYHSLDDKRRQVYKNYINCQNNKSSQQELLYCQKFITGYKKYQYCINFIQYLFHPYIYKTIKCQYQSCRKIIQEIIINNKNVQNDTDKQKNAQVFQKLYYCPYYHSIQQQRQINNIAQKQFLNKQKYTLKINPLIEIKIKSLYDIYTNNNIDQKKPKNLQYQNKIKQSRQKLENLVQNRILYEEQLKKKQQQQSKKIIYQQKKISQVDKDKYKSNLSSSREIIELNNDPINLFKKDKKNQNNQNSQKFYNNNKNNSQSKPKYHDKGSTSKSKLNISVKSIHSINSNNDNIKIQTLKQEKQKKMKEESIQMQMSFQNHQNQHQNQQIKQQYPTHSQLSLPNDPNNSISNNNSNSNSLVRTTNPSTNQPFDHSYFTYGQKVQIIQDRHHQFKIFRDFQITQLVSLILKYLTGFLNSQGGYLYLGIDDYSIAYGIKIYQKQFDKLLIGVDTDGKNRVVPPLMPQKYQLKRIPVYSNLNHKQDLYIIAIKVSKNHNKNILTTYNRECFMRMNASTIKLSILDFMEYQRMNGINLIQNNQKKKSQFDISDDQLKNMLKEDLQILKNKVQILRNRIQKAFQRRSIMNNS